MAADPGSTMAVAQQLFPGLTDDELDDIIWKHTCFRFLVRRVCAVKVSNSTIEQLGILKTLPRSEWPVEPSLEWPN